MLINPADADTRKVAEGSKVRVFNDRGAFEAVAKLTQDVNPGVVVTTLGYWRQLNKGTVNSISSAEFGDMGNSASVCDSLVQVAMA